MVQLDGGYLGKLERGVIRWPGRLYREALRADLGSTDVVLGFACPRRMVVKVDVDRKDFLLTGALALGGWRSALSGLREASCPTRLRGELYRAVAELAETAGYRAQPGQQASRVFGFALGCAEQARDWPLRAEILSSMAKQAIWAG